jgi:hypothetical protein
VIETFVFSYGRGRFLDNLLTSARVCGWTDPITVIDDGSHDRATRSVLDRAERLEGVQVIRMRKDPEGKYGGFWNNMRAAFEELATARHVMFLQDDLQFVRQIRREDVEHMERAVSDPTSSPFLFPAFQWGHRDDTQRVASLRTFDPTVGVYRRTADNLQPGFSDVCLFDRERLAGSGWQMGRPETASSAEAFAAYGGMAEMVSPLLAFVPFAPRFRRGQPVPWRSDWRRMPFPARFRILDEAETARFVDRDPAQVPVAAAFLGFRNPLRAALLRDSFLES